MGAGFVGMEFASILCEAGKEVDLLVRSEICLRHFYQPYVELAINELESKGVRFHYNQSPASIEKDGDDFIVTTQDGSTFTGDYVIGAMGLCNRRCCRHRSGKACNRCHPPVQVSCKVSSRPD